EIVLRLHRGKKTIFRKALPVTNGRYDKLVTRLEALTRGELVGALRSAGFAGERPPRAKSKEALPADLTGLLDRFTIWDQYGAVRALHELQAKKGESPERLGGLVRGYANLGVLCERQWSVAHKVFKARALLYAERLVASDPASGFALGHRA